MRAECRVFFAIAWVSSVAWPMQGWASTVVSLEPRLFAKDEVITSTQDEYCGALAGKRHYEGTYYLKLGIHAVRLVGSFDGGTPHDKKIYPISLSTDPALRFFAYYQYNDCNHERLYIIRYEAGKGFDTQTLPFCVSMPDSSASTLSCEDHALQVAASAGLPHIEPQGILETMSYSQANGQLTHTLWKYDETAIDNTKRLKAVQILDLPY